MIGGSLLWVEVHLILNPQSPRSGRQRKAWGVSPRIAGVEANKACEAGSSRIIWANV